MKHTTDSLIMAFSLNSIKCIALDAFAFTFALADVILRGGFVILAAILLTLKDTLLSIDKPMEHKHVTYLGLLQDVKTPLRSKVELLAELKKSIKQNHIPDAAIIPTFKVIRATLANSQLCEIGFSIISCLVKRLEQQDQLPIAAAEGKKTYSYILECISNGTRQTRSRAIQAFIEFWKASHEDVETIIRDTALVSNSPQVKEAAMQWLVKVWLSRHVHGLFLS